jgi:hypothetical protein
LERFINALSACRIILHIRTRQLPATF